MPKKQLTYKFLMIIFAVIVAFINLSLCIYYISLEASTPFKVSHDTYHLKLELSHLIITGCLCTYVIGLLINNLHGWLLALTALLASFVTYTHWFYEKFGFVAADYPEGTPEYLKHLDRIGIFRGGTQWDIVSLALIIFLFLYILFKVLRGFRRTFNSNYPIP